MRNQVNRQLCWINLATLVACLMKSMKCVIGVTKIHNIVLILLLKQMRLLNKIGARQKSAIMIIKQLNKKQYPLVGKKGKEAEKKEK